MDTDTQTLVETAGDIMQAEIDRAETTTAAVVAAAGDAIDEAQRQAQAIAEAAMATELGRRIYAVENRGSEWHGELDALRRDLQSLQSTVAELTGQISALATLTVVEATAETVPSLSIPAQSLSQPTLAEAVETVTEVVPESLSEATPVAQVVPQAPAKRHRFL